MRTSIGARLLLAGCVLAGCGKKDEPPPDAAAQEAAPAQTVNPLDEYVDKAAAFLSSSQSEDGSWPYFHSKSPEFKDPEPHANLFGTLITLTNLTHTGFEASSTFKRGADFVHKRMTEGHVWSFYEPGALGENSWFEPDADDTAVALTLLAGRFELKPGELKRVRALFDRHRTPEGLYLIYFDGFHREKGFVPDPNVPSIGVNVNVLGFLGKYAQPRASLVNGLDSLARGEKYWEKTQFYRTLPVLAYLASNAIENGAPEAGELMRRFLADFAATTGKEPEFASRLNTVDLAAYVKATAHGCLLEQSPCRDIDLAVFQLARRRKADGSWDAAPFYQYDANPVALEAFLDRRDFARRRKRGGYDYDVARALAAPGKVRYYDGSPAETTSFALKALVFYREVLNRRNAMPPPPSAAPGASPAAPPSASAGPG